MKKQLHKININDLELRTHFELDDCQLKDIINFDAHNKINGNSNATRLNHIRFLLRFATKVKKSFDKVTIDDINKYLVVYEKKSLEHMKEEFVKFFKWKKKPELIKHLKPSQVEDELTEDMMWTEDDILKLLKVMDAKPKVLERDQCIIMMLYDLAIERSALINLNICDVFDDGVRIKVKLMGKKRGKKRTRVLECILSSDYLRKWLNVHPNNKNPKSPLFISFSYGTYGKRINIQHPWFLLKKLKKRAGVDKKIWCHLMRHSRISELYKKGYRGIPLQKFAGWNSPAMESRYAHLSNEDIDNERYKLDTGLDRDDSKSNKRPLLSVTCPNCGNQNQPTNIYCTNQDCHFLLDQSIAKFETLMVELIRKMTRPESEKKVLESLIDYGFDELEAKRILGIKD